MNIPKFHPHLAVRGGNMQTLVAYFWSGAGPCPPDESWHVKLPDGDQVVLDINFTAQKSAPILYLLHGLGGSSESSYKRRLAEKLVKDGFHVIRHNHRGASPANIAKGIYHSGSHDDVLCCLQAIAARFPGQAIGLVGFSLSGIMVLNLLGRRQEELRKIPELKAAMTVCTMLDLHASSNALSHWSNKHYDLFYSRHAIDHFLRRDIISEDFVKTRLQKPTLRLVDEEIVAPMAGFLNAADYYSQCSPSQIVGAIELPTIVLAAADDPIVPPKAVMEAPYSRSTQLSMQRSGGHLGFVGNQLTRWGDYRWLDSVLANWAVECVRT